MDLIKSGILSKRCNTTSPLKTILHTFSGGGTNTAAQLLLLLRARLNGTTPPPPTLFNHMICDSCPSKGEYRKSHNALVLSIGGQTWQRVLASLVAHYILTVLTIWVWLGNKEPATLQRRVLLGGTERSTGQDVVGEETEEKLSVCGTTAGTAAGRICYIYSKADRICEWTDVSEHAETARAKGWGVRELRFEDSGHCAHLMRYQDEYKDAMREMWEFARV